MKSSTLTLTGVERKMDPSEIIVTKTDLDGKICYGNRTFFKYANYSPQECIGKQHNIIRHPEMPRTVFKLLWDTIQAGQEIFAYVNNRSKNGDHYWVLAHVTPSRDSNGTVIGYHSNRRAPNAEVVQTYIQPLYDELLAVEARASSPKAALEDGQAMVAGLLDEKRMGFNEMIFSLGT
ncbi:MAG: PAS domain-containing protein [Alphaproteobacteria bacterium]|nr:PAS domain-containing protein [Alphaproteobacteria bacterium]